MLAGPWQLIIHYLLSCGFGLNLRWIYRGVNLGRTVQIQFLSIMSSKERLKQIYASLLFAVVATNGAWASEPADLIITNALILTMNSERTTFVDGVIVVRDSNIVAVGEKALLREYDSAFVIDAGGDIVMPGMVNLHNHLPMVAFRGLGENGVQNRLFRFFFPVDNHLLKGFLH